MPRRRIIPHRTISTRFVDPFGYDQRLGRYDGPPMASIYTISEIYPESPDRRRCKPALYPDSFRDIESRPPPFSALVIPRPIKWIAHQYNYGGTFVIAGQKRPNGTTENWEGG